MGTSPVGRRRSAYHLGIAMFAMLTAARSRPAFARRGVNEHRRGLAVAGSGGGGRPTTDALRFAGVLLVCALCACSTRREAKAPATNLMLVTIDTLRADRLGAGFSPTLDRLGNRGLRFTRARTVVPLTLPAHVSLMTGLL